MPTPAAAQTPAAAAGAFEDTMFLIDLMRQQRQKEIRAKKVGKLYSRNNVKRDLMRQQGQIRAKKVGKLYRRNI